jgi:dihydroflavonol-4-reductase
MTLSFGFMRFPCIGGLLAGINDARTTLVNGIDNMSVLVTGATGFVGAAVLRALLARGQACRALVRPSSDLGNLQGLDVEIVTGDLNDPVSLKSAAKGVSALFHVAADYRLWVPDPESMMRANVDGSINVLRAAAEAGANRIVYTSSVAVLGKNKDGSPSDEETPVSFEDMIGIYKQSKFRAEEAVNRFIALEKAPVVIVNPSMPIGPRDIKPTPTGRMVVEAASGRMPAFVDTGMNLVHVEDVATGHLLAFDKGKIGRRYILGGENLHLKEILRLIAEIVCKKPPTIQLPHNLVMPIAFFAENWARLFGGEPFATVDGVRMAKKKMFFSSARAERELGYTHQSAHQALSDSITWFKAAGFL